ACACSFDDSGAGPPRDASPPDARVDASIPPDAPVDAAVDAPSVRCEDVCTGGSCEAGVCVIRCSTTASCTAKINCPAGVPCRVLCAGASSCGGGIDCTRASACELACTGNSSCAGELAGGATSDISCAAPGACGPISCSGQACAVRCTQSNA